MLLQEDCSPSPSQRRIGRVIPNFSHVDVRSSIWNINSVSLFHLWSIFLRHFMYIYSISEPVPNPVQQLFLHSPLVILRGLFLVRILFQGPKQRLLIYDVPITIKESRRVCPPLLRNWLNQAIQQFCPRYCTMQVAAVGPINRQESRTLQKSLSFRRKLMAQLDSV